MNTRDGVESEIAITLYCASKKKPRPTIIDLSITLHNWYLQYSGTNI